MKKLIDTTEDATWDAPEHRQRLAYHILIELLAYQFASCVDSPSTVCFRLGFDLTPYFALQARPLD